MIFQIIIVLILLALMILVMFGIGELGNRELFEKDEDIRHLRNDIEEDPDVISKSSIFNTLINKKDDDEFPKKGNM